MAFFPLPLPLVSYGISRLGEILKLIYELQSLGGKILNSWELSKYKFAPSRKIRENGEPPVCVVTPHVYFWLIGEVFDN
jgi:hypothetical protein